MISAPKAPSSAAPRSTRPKQIQKMLGFTAAAAANAPRPGAPGPSQPAPAANVPVLTPRRASPSQARVSGGLSRRDLVSRLTELREHICSHHDALITISTRTMSSSTT
ncbi:hypothetical protein V8E36_000305 [Tilletia maclaganii]